MNKWKIGEVEIIQIVEMEDNELFLLMAEFLEKNIGNRP